MKSLLSLLLFVLISFYSNAQIVDIPDANFKAALISGGVDINGDGDIQESEAELVEVLNLQNNNISDLTGISSFINLEELFCQNNLLTSLTLSGLANLYNINCSYNNLTELVLSNLPNLWNLDCNNNQLLSLDVSGLDDLVALFCFNNQLTELNITNCSNLIYIDSQSNNLTSLDFMGVGPFIDNGQYYSFSDNNISNINFPDGFAVGTFLADDNQIVDLDLSNIGYFTSGGFYNNPIETVNIKNGILNDYSSLDVEYFELQFICADESELEAITNDYDVIQNDIYVSSYCTFEPGGDYNRISGFVHLDIDSNGCDGTDLVMPNVLMEIDDGATQGFVLINQIGVYNAYVALGDYTLTPNIENEDWFVAAPNNVIVSFLDSNNIIVQDFCFEAVGVHQDIEVVVLPIISAQPGFDAKYQIVYKNKGNQIASGDIELTFDDSVLDYVSSTEGIASQTTGSLVWNYANLNPFESRSITVTLNVNSPMETPTVNIGDQLDFSATINPVGSDESPSDNTFNYKQEVIGSYDPNDITCLEGDMVSPDQIGEYLHYNINFENTGTAAATFVVVKDVIDGANYDISSLQIMYASHEMQTTVTNNTIEFIFDNINLEPNEKGNVVFKIKTLNTLTVGNSVSNQAEIFFDYNFPIETNIATTSFQVLSVDEFGIDNSISVFPNPSKDKVTLASKSNLKSIKVYDAMGRLVFEDSADNLNYTLNISNYAIGIYYLKINAEFGQKVERLIKN